MSPKKNVNKQFYSVNNNNTKFKKNFNFLLIQTLRAARPTALSSGVEPFHLFKSSQDNDSLEKSSKHER